MSLRETPEPGREPVVLGDYIALYEEAIAALRQCNIDKEAARMEIEQMRSGEGRE